jgi:hypothetical protein
VASTLVPEIVPDDPEINVGAENGSFEGAARQADEITRNKTKQRITAREFPASNFDRILITAFMVFRGLRWRGGVDRGVDG